MATTAKTSAKTDSDIQVKGPIDVIRQRWWYVGISLALLVPGVYFIILNMLDPQIAAPVRLGIDFRGGTLLEYGFERKVTQGNLGDIRAVFESRGYNGTIVQVQEPHAGMTSETAPSASATQSTASETPAPPPVKPGQAPAQPATVEKPVAPKQQTPAVEKPAATVGTSASSGKIASIVSIRSQQLKNDDASQILAQLQQKYGAITVLQKNSVGPSLASELLVNGVMALLLAYLLIVGYLSFRFQLDYAVCAIIALVHDSLFLLGFFAILGNLYHTEVDSLFITAVLTVVGFSVHDTIVVYDRIRENSRVYFTKKLPFATIANLSVNQTLARSINTSLTALLPLVALFLFGGETTRDFVLAIIVGIVVGTFSSICVASLLLAWWREKAHGPEALKASAA